MTEKVGRKTGKKTQAGRDVYETPEKDGTPHGSEMVSEKSTTFKYEDKWINIPSIHNGYRYSEDTLRLMLDFEIIEPTSVHDSEPEATKAAADRSDNLKFSEGGSISNQTEKAFSSNPFKSEKTFKRIKNVVRNAPVTGTLIDIADIGKSLLTGNYSQAAIDAGLALAGVTPVGKIASKGIQKTLKLFSKNKTDNPMGLVGSQIETPPMDFGRGIEGRDSYVKTVLVPIEEAEKLFPNRRRISAGDGSSSMGIDRIESLKSAIQSGKKLAPPFLHVDVPKKGSALLNIGHEGAHRIAALKDLGHEYVPIDILSNIKLRGEEGEKIYKNILEGDRLAGQQGYMFTKNTGKEFNKGGTAMKQQMNMAFMEEGGMKDDGMSKDPVSGNDIPAGSLAKEVRDDIPAQLSEGEYVVPADVAQYYGIKFFEDLRMEAKMGLAQMDKDGRIGGQPMSVTMIALGQEEEKKKAARGGSIGYNNGGITNASLQAQQAAANPMAGFGYTGQSLSKPPTQTNVPVTTMETWYHPDGRTQVVQRINGEIKPPEMMQYTQAPWSKDAAISNKPRKDNDREPVKLIPKVIGGKTVMMTEGNYTALETSANRLDMPLDKYYNLPFSERVGLVGKEFVEMGVASTEAAKVIKGAKEGLNFDSLIELGKLAFKLTPPGLALSFLQSLSKTPKESGSDNTGGGTGGDTGGGTNDDDGGISPSTPSNETLDSFTGGSSTDSSPKKVSSGISTIASGAKKVIEDEAAANLREQNMNQGGLLTKPKRKPKKPRGKGLASK